MEVVSYGCADGMDPTLKAWQFKLLVAVLAQLAVTVEPIKKVSGQVDDQEERWRVVSGLVRGVDSICTETDAESQKGQIWQK